MSCPGRLITPDKSIPSRLGLYANGLPGVTLSLFDDLTKDEQEDYLEFWEDIYQRSWDNFVSDIQMLLSDKFHIDLKQVSRETSKFLPGRGDDLLSGVKIELSLSKYSQISLLTADVYLSYPLVNVEQAAIEWNAGASIPGITSVAFGGGLFVAVGEGGIIKTSPDGITWTARTSPTASDLFVVTYGKGRFVALGSTTSLTSFDGITWDEVTISSGGWTAVRYVDFLGLFIAISEGPLIIMTSPNGQNWTVRTTPISTGNWSNIAFGNGIVVLGGGDSRVLTSNNGITWTLTTGLSVTVDSIAFGNGYFVADDGSNFFYSEDALTWIEGPFSGTTVFTAPDQILFTGEYFIAITDSFTALSNDGVNWHETDPLNPASQNLGAYNDDTFVFAVGNNAVYGIITGVEPVSLELFVYDTDQDGDLLGTYEVDEAVIGKNTFQINTPFNYEDLFVAFRSSILFRTSENKYFSTDTISSDKLSCTFPCGYSEGSVTQVNGGGVNVKFNVHCSIEKVVCENINIFKMALWYRIGVELMIERRLSDKFNRWTTLTVERSEELMVIYQGEYDKHLKNSVKSLSLREDPICFQCASIVDSSTVLP